MIGFHAFLPQSPTTLVGVEGILAAIAQRPHSSTVKMPAISSMHRAMEECPKKLSADRPVTRSFWNTDNPQSRRPRR